MMIAGQAGTLYRSSIVQLSAAAIAGSISARGYDPLVSHIATVLCPTCSADASSACVKPRFVEMNLRAVQAAEEAYRAG